MLCGLGDVEIVREGLDDIFERSLQCNRRRYKGGAMGAIAPSLDRFFLKK